MRVLILEPHATGHHASYLRWLVQGILKKGWDVVIATTSPALSHPALRAIRAEYETVEIYQIKDADDINGAAGRSAQLIRREFSYWRCFKRAVEEVSAVAPVDGIILPYVDYCFHALAILGTPFKGIPWCGISMRLAVVSTGSSVLPPLPWKWRMARRLLRESNLRALFVINPSVSDVPPNWRFPKARPCLHYLPDPAEFAFMGLRRESRAALGIPDAAVVILVFGSIDERKGIDSLIGVLASEKDLSGFIVILAGEQSAQIRNQIHAPRYAQLWSDNRFIIFDRYLSETEQGTVFASADVVWVGYRNHVYMSGVLVLAGKAALPVVGTTEGEIGRLIRKHGLGSAARIDQPAEVAGALRVMLDVSARTDIGRRAKQAFAEHTAESFGARVLAELEMPHAS